MAFRAKMATIRHLIGTKIGPLLGHRKWTKRKNKTAGFSIAVKEKLALSYRHYWPEPYMGHVDIICSAVRMPGFVDEDGVWARLLPNRRLHDTLNEHNEVGTRTASEKLEAIIAAGQDDQTHQPDQSSEISA